MDALSDGLTPTEQKIVDALSDGLTHSIIALHPCLVDDLSPATNVYIHICNIRKKIRPNGHDIISEKNGIKAGGYRLVRLTPNAYDGKH